MIACTTALLAGAGGAYATPVNDNFPGTDVAGLPYFDSVDSTGATVENDEPFAQCNSLLEATVWWQFTPLETARYILTLTTDGSWSPLFAVWGPSDFPGGGLSEVTCGGYPAYPGEPVETEFTAFFQGDAGVTYYIQLGGFSFFGEDIANSGPVTLSLTQAEPPPNDDLASATEVTSLPFTRTDDVTGATTEDWERTTPCLPSIFGYPVEITVETTVWYRYTADRNEALVVESEGEFAYPLIGVWSGEPDAPEMQACGNPVGFEVEAGHTYYINVGQIGFDGGFGGGDLETHFERIVAPVCPGPSQEFRDAIDDAWTYENFGPDPVHAPGSIADLRRVTAGASRDWACFNFEFTHDVPNVAENAEEAVVIDLAIDSDRSLASGYLLGPYPGCHTAYIGADLEVYASNSPNLVAALYDPNVFIGELAPSPEYAFQWTSGNTITVAVPLSALDGNAISDVLAVSHYEYEYDCVPDFGKISEEPPAKAVFGDVNCDSVVNARDGVAVLREVAGAPPSDFTGCPQVGSELPGYYAASGSARLTSGDLDCDGNVTAADALSIFRQSDGLPGTLTPQCPPLGQPPA